MREKANATVALSGSRCFRSVLKVPAAAELHSVLNCLTLVWINKLANPQMMQAFTSNLISFKFNKLAIKVEAKCRDATRAVGFKVKASNDVDIQ